MAEISQNVNIEMLEKLPDGTYKRKYPATKAEVVKLVDAQNKFTNKNVEGAMNELFTNVSSGKELVGGAITDVDDSVVIPTDPTFGDLASAIGGISTGKKWSRGTVSRVGSAITIDGLDFSVSYLTLYTDTTSDAVSDVLSNSAIYDVDKNPTTAYLRIGTLYRTASVSKTSSSITLTSSEFTIDNYMYLAFE